ncbi:MAG: hypothetical protein HF973_01400 [Chloroflexi bacterium]|nr:hypothetical protein [Chloroflexota bacterium]
MNRSTKACDCKSQAETGSMLKHTGHAGTRFSVFPVSAAGLYPADMGKKTASTKNLHDSTCCLNANETHPLLYQIALQMDETNKQNRQPTFGALIFTPQPLPPKHR